jgi:dTDP-4-dehydrorhamnose reductase
VRPLNAYARSKVEGEKAVREALPDRHLVLRTAWLYGPDPAERNFLLRLVNRIAAGEVVAVPPDQWGTPTYTDDLAEATRLLVERGYIGTFHAVGPEMIDRVSLARRACAHFGLDGDRVVPTPARELGQLAIRPQRVQLDCGRLRAAAAERFRGIDSGLESLGAWYRCRDTGTRRESAGC